MSILLLGFLDSSDLAPPDRQNNGPPKMPLPVPLPPSQAFLTWQEGLSVIIKVQDIEMGRLTQIIQVDLI